MQAIPGAVIMLLASLSCVTALGETAEFDISAAAAASELKYIDTSFENASPLWYQYAADGVVHIHLLYDHERASPNRAAGHVHFMVQAEPGSELTLEFEDRENVWNGKRNSLLGELNTVVVSADGRKWHSLPLDRDTEHPGRFTVRMTGPKLYVARVEPYRLSDLQSLLESIKGHPQVEITRIGETLQGRPLEIVRIGDSAAPYRVFLRARAHPWESGGNWVLEGLIRRLLSDDDEAQAHLRQYCLYVMPMANKDGVVHGRTRFNMQGMDLNRKWDAPADPELAPENYALEKWLESMIESGSKPHLAMELHNDGWGMLHISRAPTPRMDQYLQRMVVLERLLNEHTWFTEGTTKPSFRNAGTLAEGWLERYDIDAVVHEFNCNWIAALNDHPTSRHWKEYGGRLTKVFGDYFEQVAPGE